MSKGERGKRCLWQMQRPERVAAVGKTQARTAGRRVCRAPQQGNSTMPLALFTSMEPERMGKQKRLSEESLF